MLASVPIGHVEELLQDTGNVGYSDAQLLSWWNEAQRVIASIKPEASVSTTALELARNETKHPLAAGQNAVVDIIRNMGSDGATPGKPVRMIQDRRALEDAEPTWHSATGVATVSAYYYDIRNPKVLWTYPRTHATTAVFVEGVFNVTPTDVADAGNAITIAEEYEPAGVAWMLYRCLSRDSRRTPLFNRALHHLSTFALLLGLEVKGNVLNDPRLGEHLEGPGAAAAAQATGRT